MSYKILVINPGGTSTKVSLFEDEQEIKSDNIRHSKDDLKNFEKVIDQFEYRSKLVKELLSSWDHTPSDLSAVVGRGGPFKPLKSGTYLVDNNVLDDVLNGRVQAEHPSNLGVLIANEISKSADINAYFVDPVSVDELLPHLRITGLPDIERNSLFHALNMKAIARKAAADLNKPYDSCTMIIVHMGSGISVGVQKNGVMIDVNNALEHGPFAPQRAGGLPAMSLARLCYSQKYSLPQLKKILTSESGVYGYLKTDDMKSVIEKSKSGDEKSKLVYDAMVYQICQEIGGRATTVSGKVDIIAITGGIAHSNIIIDDIRSFVDWIAPVKAYPGEDEMSALALGALRILNKTELPMSY